MLLAWTKRKWKPGPKYQDNIKDMIRTANNIINLKHIRRREWLLIVILLISPYIYFTLPYRALWKIMYISTKANQTRDRSKFPRSSTKRYGDRDSLALASDQLFTWLPWVHQFYLPFFFSFFFFLSNSLLNSDPNIIFGGRVLSNRFKVI